MCVSQQRGWSRLQAEQLVVIQLFTAPLRLPWAPWMSRAVNTLVGEAEAIHHIHQLRHRTARAGPLTQRSPTLGVVDEAASCVHCQFKSALRFITLITCRV
jgi:hypothetical protein